MADWRDKYDHVPESNGTFCNDCGRYCKKKTKVGYRQKDMYIVYKIRMSDNGVLHWVEIKRVCPECKDKVHVNERTLIRKITDWNSPLPDIRVRQKCNVV